MSRSLHTNRDFEKFEPYEGKPSRTVLRGEEGSNALDLPDRPSDLQQRDGRGIRKGNEVAKLYADNKVDVIIYAVEKSLDSYKFNLLYNKQLFITQLKQNNMGCRTIDEGGMDEKGGIPFSEYVAVLSGNTDLLDKARLEKRIAGMEGERKAFQRGKGESRIKLETFLANRASNDDIIARVRKDKAAIESRMQYDKEGNRLNPLKIDGVAGDDPKVIAAKLHEIEDRERTHGQPKVIGSLYGFDIVVKTDTTVKDGLDFCENRFFVRGEGNFLYNYNNGRLAVDPKTACQNFINAFDSIPRLIEKYTRDNEAIEKELPVLEQVVGEVWKKEDELKQLKADLAALDRKILLSLKSVDGQCPHTGHAPCRALCPPDARLPRRQAAHSAQTKRNAQKHQHQRGNGSAWRQARHRRRSQVRQQGRSRS